MEHTASKIKVYMTTDYKMFKFIDGNRKTNPKKKKRIIKEIEGGNDILDESPILVKEDKAHLVVLDGQNRLEIARDLKRPVHYIVKKQDMSIYGVAKINSNVEKWKAEDFINSYIAHGNTDYKKVLDFHKKYGVSIGTCLVMLTKGTMLSESGRDEIVHQFEIGAYKVLKQGEAVKVMEICKTFDAFPKWNNRPFIVAICKILQADKCDMERLVKKFKRDATRLKDHPNWKGFANNLQEIYNLDNQKQQVIY